MSNTDDPSKEEQTRIKRRKVVKHLVKPCKWLTKLLAFYRFYRWVEDPIGNFLEWLFEGDGSGPLDNYIVGGIKTENTEPLSQRTITLI